MTGKSRRGTWPLAVAGVGLLTAGAWFFGTPGVQDELREKSLKALQAGGEQARVEVRGRDVLLSGQIASDEQRQQLVERVLAIRGVRRVDASALQVARAQPEADTGSDPAAASREQPQPMTAQKPQPAPMQPPASKPSDEQGQAEEKDVAAADPSPAVEAASAPPSPPPPPKVSTLVSNSAQPRITGIIEEPEKVRQLKVELAGRTYVEGDGHLRRDGSEWVLVPAEALPEGVHDVKVIAIGEGDASSTDETQGELTVDMTPPAAPRVEELRLAGMQAIMRGSWPEGDAKLLRIIIDGEKFDIDDPGSPLVRDGDGRFRLMLPANRLPAMRKARLLVIDAARNVAEATPPAEVVGNACQQQVDEVLIQDMIHFRTGSAEISDDSMQLLQRLAQVLKNCTDMQVIIVGHTDNVGDLIGNRQLSEARANAVKQVLVEQGLSPEDIIARGEGETQPLVPNDSDRNRQINRRIEISVRQKQL